MLWMIFLCLAVKREVYRKVCYLERMTAVYASRWLKVLVA